MSSMTISISFRKITQFLRRKNKAAVNLKTGRFESIDSAVIISSASKAVYKVESMGSRNVKF